MLRYLDLSGNKLLKIQLDLNGMSVVYQQYLNNRKIFADSAELRQLRVLGLMDVIVTQTCLRTMRYGVSHPSN